MNSTLQNENIAKFRELHKGGLLYLPNAYSGGSAKVFEKSGFKAIGTSSAGIAYSLGYSDGEHIEFSDLIRVTKEIMKVTSLPLSVDMERGYSEDLLQIIDNIRSIIKLGVVGINIEDGLAPDKTVDKESDFVKKIKAIAKIRDELDIDFFINVRTDIYLLSAFDENIRFSKTIERANALREAGADCIFIPGALDENTIRSLRKEIDLPINLFVHKAFNDSAVLKEIGIERLSSGSAPARTTFSSLISVADDFSRGNCKSMLDHIFDYASANKYFK